MNILTAIPVYNESKYVTRVVDKIRNFAPGDILCVDDGSTDGTGDILAARGDIRLVRHAVNQGYGTSIIDAFAYGAEHGYDWVITIDCDEQHEPERIPDFLRLIETDQYDVISGSRYMAPRSDDDLPPGDRRTINATLTALLNDLYDFNITDAFCGFKAHRVSSMTSLNLTEPGYAFPMQFWPEVAAKNLRLVEIPVRLIYNDPTRHFGGKLDDACERLRHYLDVLNTNARRAGAPTFRKAKRRQVESTLCTTCD